MPIGRGCLPSDGIAIIGLIMQDHTFIRPAPTGGDGRTRGAWRTELVATARLAWPLALANLLQMLVYATDVVFVARLGAFDLAASSLAVSVLSIIAWSLIGMVAMSSALIAAALGRERFAVREIRRDTRMAIWLGALSGLFAMVLLSQTERLLLWSGQEPDLAARAMDYMAIVLWAMPALLVANALRAFVSAMGWPGIATAITAIAILVNAAGNYALVFGNWGAPALGLEGSAIATVLTSIATLLAYIVAVQANRRLRRYSIFGRLWRPDWVKLWQLVRLGAPVMFTTLAEAGLFGGAALLMGRIGTLELAAHTLALQLAALAFQVPYGIAQAATIRVGYHFGARDAPAAGRAGWTGLGLATGFMSLTAAMMLFMPETLLSAYIDVDDLANAALVALAVRYMLVAAVFQLVDGIQVVAAGALRGLQDTRVPMWFAIFSYWVPGFGLSWYLGLHSPLEGTGVWIGFAVGLATATVLLGARWAWRERLGIVGERG